VKHKYVLIALFLFTIVTDQVSKLIIHTKFDLNESVSLIKNILYLRYIKNPGIAFGLSFGHPLFMLAVTTIIIIILFILFLKGKIASENELGKIAMVMILGGAIGNLIDRIRMKEVIDFIDMGLGRYRWPVYNLADTYVTIGMFILIYVVSFKDSQRNDSIPNASD